MQPTTDKKIDYSKKFEGKVFVIITNTFKFMGGAERQALILADYLVSEIGAEVHFIAFEDGDKLKNIIEAIGCKWKYIPLNFYKSKKTPISTVSVNQASKPIYKSSVNSNEGFSKYLTEMFHILDTKS